MACSLIMYSAIDCKSGMLAKQPYRDCADLTDEDSADQSADLIKLKNIWRRSSTHSVSFCPLLWLQDTFFA